MVNRPRHLSRADSQGLVWRSALVGVAAYCRLVHRLRVQGIENLPTTGPAIIVANHTAGVDPVVAQGLSPLHIRWMMAQEMMIDDYDWLWSFLGVIPVGANPNDTSPVRESLRILQQGGVVGIFPEGGIERPPGVIRPFMPGVGLLVKRAKVPVIPCLIDGTPYTATAWGSLIRPSRTRVRFLPAATDLRGGPAEIAKELEARFRGWLGWK